VAETAEQRGARLSLWRECKKFVPAARPTCLSGKEGCHRWRVALIIQVMEPSGYSDEELVSLARSSGAPSRHSPYLNELFRRYARRVSLWCLRYTGDRESAADLAQDVFLTAYRKLDSFRAESKFSTWLYVITRNTCLNEVGSGAARQSAVTGPLPDDLAGGQGLEIDARLDDEKKSALLRRLLQENLDETERSVLTLHYGQGLPLATITGLLGLENPSGSKAFIVSARRKLERAVERWKTGCQTERT